jgi:hypothetical protein
LGKVYDAAKERASTEGERADAEKLGTAANEAGKGNKDRAIQVLRQVGNWGWALVKELATSMASESLKSLLVR